MLIWNRSQPSPVKSPPPQLFHKAIKIDFVYYVCFLKALTGVKYEESSPAGIFPAFRPYLGRAFSGEVRGHRAFTHRGQHGRENRSHTLVTRVGFESTDLVFEQSRSVSWTVTVTYTLLF